MRKNPISAKYEPLQVKLINKVHKLNTKVYNAIKNANVTTTDDLLMFLGAYIMLQFGSVRKATNNYLGVVKEDVKEISNNNDLAPNKRIINQMQNQTYIELNTNLVCAEKELMQEFRAVTKPYKNKPTHITDIKSVLQQEFVKNGGVKVTYKNGARMPLDKYFAMATRTARNETQNTTAIDNAKKLGTDYVYMAPNHSSCKTCATMGNRVYCISGKDPKYPSVYDTLFKHGYNCIHPHCKCVLRPYFIDNHTNNEIKEIQKNSNRSFDLDPRTEQQRQQYQESQAFNHRQWSSQQKFEQMQKVYGKDAPYKTLGGLRRGKTLDSENYKTVNKALIDQKQYDRWAKAIGKENMPTNLAKFQELKYNNSVGFNALYNKVKIERHRASIRENPSKLIVEVGKQQKHIKGSNNYQDGKSYLTIDVKEVQNLIDQHATHGVVRLTKNGAISNKELINCGKPIGYCKDKQGKWVETQHATIHYSKNGTHLVPTIKE